MPTSSAKKHAASPRDARSRILSAAREAFIAGDGAIEMGDVARRAGVSNGLAYHYYGSKAGLLAALVDDFYARYDEAAMAGVASTGHWAERMYHHLRAGIDFMYAEPMAGVLLGRIGTSAEVSAAEARRQIASTERAISNLRRAQARGDIDPMIDVEMAGAVIIGAVRQVLMRVFSHADRPAVAVVAERLWATIAAVLGLSAPIPVARD